MVKPGDAPADDDSEQDLTPDDPVHRPGEDAGVADEGNPTDPENPTG